MRHAALDGDAQLGHVAEADGVVLAAADGGGQVVTDLVGVDVEGRRELDVGDVVATEVGVHQPGHGLVRLRVAVVVDALDEGRGAVADADDGDAHLAGALAVPAGVAVGGGRFGHA